MTIHDGRRHDRRPRWCARCRRKMKRIWERFAHAEFVTDWDATVAIHGQTARPRVLMPTQRQPTRVGRVVAGVPDGRASTPLGIAAAGNRRSTFAWMWPPYERTLASMGLIDRVLPRRRPNRPSTSGAARPREGVLVDACEAIAATIHGHIRRGRVRNSGRRGGRPGAARRPLVHRRRPPSSPASPRRAACGPAAGVIVGRCQVDHVDDWQTPPDLPPAANGGDLVWQAQSRQETTATASGRDEDGRWHTYRPDGSEISLEGGPQPTDHPKPAESSRLHRIDGHVEA